MYKINGVASASRSRDISRLRIYLRGLLKFQIYEAIELNATKIILLIFATSTVTHSVNLLDINIFLHLLIPN